MAILSMKQVRLLLLPLVWAFQASHGVLAQGYGGSSSSSTSTSSTTITTTTTSSSSSSSSTAGPPLSVTVFSPTNGDIMGYNGDGWVVDLAIDASGSQNNDLLSMSAGYQPFFNNPTNTTTFKAGADPGVPGLVVLLSTTPTVNGSSIQGPTTNLAGFFQINTVALTNNGTTKQIWSTWQVGAAAFGINSACQLTVFVVNGTAPTYITSAPQNATGLISNVVQVSFTIAGTQTAV